MKRYLALCMALLMLLSLAAGCKPQTSTPPADSEHPDTAVAATPDTTAPTEPKESEQPAVPSPDAPIEPDAVEVSEPEIDHEAIVAALNVDEALKPELVRSSQYGFPLDKLEQETITGAEMAELVDGFVSLTAPERLAEWQTLYPEARAEQAPINRICVMAYLYLAADFVSETYSFVTDWSWDAYFNIYVDWGIPYPELAIFGKASEAPLHDLGLGGDLYYLDAASHIFTAGRKSLYTGETLFSLDPETNSYLISDGCTYRDALLAVTRLLDSVPDMTPEAADPAVLDTLVNLGFVDAALTESTDAIITRGQLVDIFSRIHTARYGVESKFLADTAALSPELEANRLWFAILMFYSEMEYHMAAPYETPTQLVQYVFEHNHSNYCSPNASFIGLRPDGTVGEMHASVKAPDIPMLYGWPVEGFGEGLSFDLAASFAAAAADRTSGEKVLRLLSDCRFCADVAMTVGEALMSAMRYYHYTEPQTLIDCADMGDYDHSIIIEALLSKDTDLPDASCAVLPDSWRGVLVSDIQFSLPYMLDQKADQVLLGGDLDVIKEAGFNFIGLSISFDWLQGMHPERGKFSEARLQTLDQIIARCMERDIHVDLRVNGVGDFPYTASAGEWLPYHCAALVGTDQIDSFALYWGALARRYQDIPNTYLSFNLFAEPIFGSEAICARFLAPAIEAIRQYTPDRCIIADVHDAMCTGESMAQLGVALSYHQYDPRDFCAYDAATAADADYLSSVTWPYNGIDMEATMTMRMGGQAMTSVAELQALAQQYGVGMMVGEIGIFTEEPNGLVQYRYSDETIDAYFQDVADTYAKYGIGWCSGHYCKDYSILNSYPAIKGTVYSTRENTTYYVDETMMDIFQRINGVK